MSINVRCEITIGEQKYEGNAEDMPEIIKGVSFFNSTGTFARFSRKAFESLIADVTQDAQKAALKQLRVIKGDK